MNLILLLIVAFEEITSYILFYRIYIPLFCKIYLIDKKLNDLHSEIALYQNSENKCFSIRSQRCS